jgi:membrane protein implicated in regulation of membrane protease activity
VFVDGALWQAGTADDSELVPGEHVEVQAVNGLRLTVRR